MDILKEDDAKRQAARRADMNGHEMRPWRRHPSAYLRSRSSCTKCGFEMIVVSQILDIEQAEAKNDQGDIIGFYANRPNSCDFTHAFGAALNYRCRS
ncbi:hypothetical protein [Xanthobacter autotrophicus]|uniref:hypothetical protein n=1 Tax=Xanthobacter autotrophicus TaxID=280 RepID=UPI00372894D3